MLYVFRQFPKSHIESNEIIYIPARVRDLLCVFVKSPQITIGKNDLIREAWGEVKIDLAHYVKKLRDLLGDRNQLIIRNIFSTGYCFTADVKVIDKNVAIVVDISQYAELNQEIRELKNRQIITDACMRSLEKKIDILASIIGRQSIEFLLMITTDPSVRASIVYDAVAFANHRLIGREQEVQIGTLLSIYDYILETLNYYRGISSVRELELVMNLCRFWDIQGHWTKGCNILEDVLFRHSHTVSDAQAVSLAWLSYLSYCRDDYETANKAAIKSSTVSKQIGNDEALSLSLHTLAAIAEAKGQYQHSRSLFNEALKVAKKAKMGWLISWTLRELGKIAEAEENYLSAEKLYNESLTKRQQIEDSRGVAVIKNYLCSVATKLQKIEEAHSLVDESLSFSSSGGDRFGLTCAYFNLGLIEESSRQFKTSYDNYRQAMILRQEMDDKRGQARCLEAMAKIKCQMNEDRKSAPLFGLADHIRRTIHAPLSPSERKAYGELSLTVKKKYLKEFNRGGQLLDSSAAILDS